MNALRSLASSEDDDLKQTYERFHKVLQENRTLS